MSPASWLKIERFDHPSDIFAKLGKKQIEEFSTFTENRGVTSSGAASPLPNH